MNNKIKTVDLNVSNGQKKLIKFINRKKELVRHPIKTLCICICILNMSSKQTNERMKEMKETKETSIEEKKLVNESLYLISKVF